MSFIFLNERDFLQALFPVGKLFSCSIQSLQLQPDLPATLSLSCVFLFSPTHFLRTTQSPRGEGGGGQRAHLGSVWGGLLIQACCRHPALSICRYFIKPGIPRGFEKPAGGQWALSPHLILTSAVIIPRCWQAEAESLSFPAPSS